MKVIRLGKEEFIKRIASPPIPGIYREFELYPAAADPTTGEIFINQSVAPQKLEPFMIEHEDTEVSLLQDLNSPIEFAHRMAVRAEYLHAQQSCMLDPHHHFMIDILQELEQRARNTPFLSAKPEDFEEERKYRQEVFIELSADSK